MPFTLPPRTPGGPRRRSLLATAAGAVLLAGCTSGPGPESAEGDTRAAEQARARVARDSTALAERYAAVLAAHPQLTELLTPLRDEVVRHVQAFTDGAATGTPSPASAPASATPPAAPSAVPADAGAALAELATAETRLADRRIKELPEVPGELARLMASVAAAGAGHAFLLREGAK
ncbi:lipoprotein [Streptomyces ruber]|uniref:Lipoprotein n=2 Tax=Streptomyces TaxID=1883 RepID=A0A918BSI8_9ACTN|nr:hypothetical protein [Streptomyces ruber]GGQ87563.1 lipoprotein [Streptomyces ruber]